MAEVRCRRWSIHYSVNSVRVNHWSEEEGKNCSSSGWYLSSLGSQALPSRSPVEVLILVVEVLHGIVEGLGRLPVGEAPT